MSTLKTDGRYFTQTNATFSPSLDTFDPKHTIGRVAKHAAQRASDPVHAPALVYLIKNARGGLFEEHRALDRGAHGGVDGLRGREKREARESDAAPAAAERFESVEPRVASSSRALFALARRRGPDLLFPCRMR